jgi:hypothetical protein
MFIKTKKGIISILSLPAINFFLSFIRFTSLSGSSLLRQNSESSYTSSSDGTDSHVKLLYVLTAIA